MKIYNLNVNGELILNSKFDNINILLGENNTGKSTFLKLLLYALGVNINNFIEEIAKEEKCNAVSIAVQTKSDNRYIITRKLPYADIVNIFPVDETGSVMTEEVLVYNLDEYSDFLLEEELYPKETISYGQGKTASLRYYFLLRGAVVDQTTPHARILSNLSGEKNDYIASQPLVNAAIIEKILSRNTAEIQKLRLSLKAKEKERSKISARISFLTEIVSEKLQANPDYPKTAEKIRAAIGEINIENNKLSTEKYDVLTQLEQSSDKQLEAEILRLKKLLNAEKERHTDITLNISDTIETQNKLKEELDTIKKRLTSQKVIFSVPVTICPICLSEIEQDTLCNHCKDIDARQNIENLSGYKKLIDDSLNEADFLLKQYRKELTECDAKINNITNELNNLKENYLSKLERLRAPLQEIIDELKERIRTLTTRKIALTDLLEYLQENEKNKNHRKQINEELKELQDAFEKASQKSSDDIKIVDVWIQYYNEIYNEIFGSSSDEIRINDEYMPSVNGTDVHRISSESVKLVAQLAYIFTLATLNEKLDKPMINHLGFMIFDSPKDKDLDMDKYKRFLSLLNKVENTQIFLTGSILDEAAYKETIPTALYLPSLSKKDRLLRSNQDN